MAIATVWTSCLPCQGTGALRDGAGGNPAGQCGYCQGEGKIVAYLLDDDLVDRLNDILEKCNDIFEKVNV